MSYPSTGLLNLSHLPWLIGNNLLTNAQLLEELFLCLQIIFVQQCLQFHIYEFIEVFHVPCVPSRLASKSSLLKRQNHRSHVSCNGACSPSASWSNRCDSVAVFFKWKQKNKAVCECSLFGINFDILKTTIQHYLHTFPIYHSCVSDTCWWHNKMAQCQIFIVQTALVHHLLPEIRISYLYTWYLKTQRNSK